MISGRGYFRVIGTGWMASALVLVTLIAVLLGPLLLEVFSGHFPSDSSIMDKIILLLFGGGPKTMALR